jgi:integrase
MPPLRIMSASSARRGSRHPASLTPFPIPKSGIWQPCSPATRPSGSRGGRLRPDAAEFAAKALEGIDWMEGDYLLWRVENDLDEMIAHWGRWAHGLLDERGIILDPSDKESLGRLCRALNDTAIATRDDQRARLGGKVLPRPADPVPPVVGHAPASAAIGGLSFADIAESILENPRLAIGAATKQASRTALRSFRETHGTPLPSKITKAVVTEWLNLLAKRPARLAAADRKLSLRDLVARYEGRDVPKLTNKTMGQHLASLGALWNKAQGEEGHIPEGQSNPFMGRKSLAPAAPTTRKGFSPEELRAIFALPVFTRGERPRRGKGEASYWLPLLLLWTGARPEELAQLMVDDVFQDPDDPQGRWLLRITDEGTHPHKGQRTLKTSKKGSGRRTFPIHQMLLDLNLLAYVAHVRASGENALFPLLRTKGGERVELFAGFGAWWGQYLRDHGVIPPVDQDAGRRPAREFRHNWTTAARVCRIPEDAREYLQGHSRTGATSNDKYGEKASLGTYLEQLSFVGLDLSAVKPWLPG